MNYIEIYKVFLDKWGYEAQARICIEEMSELTKELCKLERYKQNKEKAAQIIQNIKEEVADVLNTVEQMAFYYGFDEIEKIRKEKIEKAMKRIRG